jgi:hypothetical protein
MVSPHLDWTKLPDKLRYLAEPAEKYGHYQFDERILDFYRNEFKQEHVAELKVLGLRASTDKDAIDQWLADHSLTEHPEAALVYFLGHFMFLGYELGKL